MSSINHTHPSTDFGQTWSHRITRSGSTILAALALTVAAGLLAATGTKAPTGLQPDAVYSAPTVIEDWRGNSASFRPADAR
jgi:hypothetical protein